MLKEKLKKYEGQEQETQLKEESPERYEEMDQGKEEEYQIIRSSKDIDNSEWPGDIEDLDADKPDNQIALCKGEESSEKVKDVNQEQDI